MTVAVSPPAVKPTLGDLMLAEERALFDEGLHQRTCRARAEGRECVACLDYEAAWLAAERAVSELLKGS